MAVRGGVHTKVARSGRVRVRRAVVTVGAVAAVLSLSAASCDPPPGSGGTTTTTGATTTSEVVTTTTTTTSTTTTTTTPPAGPIDEIEIGGETVTVEVAAGLTVSVDAADPSTLPPVPDGLVGPLGALDITVDGVTPGAVARVTVTFESPIDLVNKLIDGAWDPFGHDGSTGATLAPDGLSVTIDLEDGGRGDTDGVADGTIVDPLLPLTAPGVVITTDSTTPVIKNTPYEFQFDAVGPDPGAVTWSVLQTDALGDFTLSPEGVMSGTLEGSRTLRYPAFVRVQATDGVTTDTKLVMFGTIDNRPVDSSEAPLPDGSGIEMSVTPATNQFEASADIYRADGSLDRGTRVDVATVQRVTTVFNPSGTLVVHRWQNSSSMSLPPSVVLDTDTGATVATLPAPSQAYDYQTAWSPDGAFVLLPDYSANQRVSGTLYETGGWTLVREFDLFGLGKMRWSPDSSRLFDTGGNDIFNENAPTTEIHVLEAPTFTTGPTISIAQPDCTARDMSTGDRLALTCPAQFGNIITVSAIDGSDVRDLFQECAIPFAFPCDYLPQEVAFSPSGSHLVWFGTKVLSASPFTAERIVSIVPDTDGATSTTLITSDANGYAFLFRWR